MKKIKKILPVLLGVMVLMFGTLTVCAAEEDSPYYDNAMTVYDSFQKYVENSTEYSLSDFKFIYIGTYSSSNPITDYRLVASDKNFTYDEDGRMRFQDGAIVYWGGKDFSAASSTMSFSRTSGALISSYYKPRFTSFNLYTSQGKLLSTVNYDFFKKPPVALVAQNLPGVVTAQTKVILITAIACLALLTILLVLPKKLPRFLNR